MNSWFIRRLYKHHIRITPGHHYYSLCINVDTQNQKGWVTCPRVLQLVSGRSGTRIQNSVLSVFSIFHADSYINGESRQGNLLNNKQQNPIHLFIHSFIQQILNCLPCAKTTLRIYIKNVIKEKTQNFQNHLNFNYLNHLFLKSGNYLLNIF